MRKEDVKVLFDEGVLTTKGERKVEKETKGETAHRTERFYGAFERGFAPVSYTPLTLPTNNSV